MRSGISAQNPRKIRAKSAQNPRKIRAKSAQNPRKIRAKSAQNPRKMPKEACNPRGCIYQGLDVFLFAQNYDVAWQVQGEIGIVKVS